MTDLGALYEAMFLTGPDLPGLQKGEGVHRTEGEEGDKAWKYCEGVKAGFNVWQKIEGTELKRHVDARFLFPSESRARRYHRQAMERNSEKMPPVFERPAVGEGTRVFSGTDPLGLGSKMHIFLFSAGPVVAKVFTSGVDLAGGTEIARRAESRIRAALGAHPPSPPPPEPPRNSERWPRGEVEYEEKLPRHRLVPGVGVEGLLTFKDTVKTMFETIGGGDERPAQPFWYHFERGSFGFSVQGRYQRATRQFDIVRMLYHDDPYSQMSTDEGVTVGTEESALGQAMGEPDAPPKPREGWLWYKGGIALGLAGRRVEAIELFPPVA